MIEVLCVYGEFELMPLNVGLLTPHNCMQPT